MSHIDLPQGHKDIPESPSLASGVSVISSFKNHLPIPNDSHAAHIFEMHDPNLLIENYAFLIYYLG
jgi:hypothetical protein